MTIDDDLLDQLGYLQSKLEGHLKRKEYELALTTTEDLIDLYSANQIEEFDLQIWLDYYSKIKEHLFTKTLDEKREIITELVENQEIVRFNKFQRLMKLNYIEDFEFVIKSLPETEIFTFTNDNLDFHQPQRSSIQSSVDEFLNHLHMIIQ